MKTPIQLLHGSAFVTLMLGISSCAHQSTQLKVPPSAVTNTTSLDTPPPPAGQWPAHGGHGPFWRQRLDSRNSGISLINDAILAGIEFGPIEDDAFLAGGAKPYFEIEGPFDVGAPVHEGLTVSSLAAAGYVPIGENTFIADRNKTYWEVVRGVIWNDDPAGLFFGGKNPLWTDKEDSSNFSTGAEWFAKFKEAERAAAKHSTIPKNLTARTHFGDLQFLHAMASTNAEKASMTQGRALVWLHFCYQVATGEIVHSAPLKNTEIAPLALMGGNVSVAELFHVTGKEKSTIPNYTTESITKSRALGSMLHLIQDSYSTAHTERSETKNSAGYRRIKKFLCYLDQDKSAHGEADDSPGASEPEIIKASSDLIRLAKQNRPWPEAGKLLGNVFDVVDPNASSGPGNFGPHSHPPSPATPDPFKS